jgi:hypothetical protein
MRNRNFIHITPGRKRQHESQGAGVFEAEWGKARFVWYNSRTVTPRRPCAVRFWRTCCRFRFAFYAFSEHYDLHQPHFTPSTQDFCFEIP